MEITKNQTKVFLYIFGYLLKLIKKMGWFRIFFKILKNIGSYFSIINPLYIGGNNTLKFFGNKKKLIPWYSEFTKTRSEHLYKMSYNKKRDYNILTITYYFIVLNLFMEIMYQH